MTTKQCFKCKQILPLDSFYKHPQMSGGRVNKCKECNKKDVRENRVVRIDYYREYDKARANNANRVAAREEYANTPEGIAAHKRARAKWLENNVIKRAAQIIVGNAVRDKRLTKPSSCTNCGETKKRIEGHHCDYSKPLDVMWLCSKCHSNWHKVNTPLNGE